MDWSFSTGNGPWAEVPFNASDFTGSGAMTWTVAADNVEAYTYSIRGKAMTVAFTISETSVGGTPDLELLIKLPLGLSAKRWVSTYCFIQDNESQGPGNVFVQPGNTSLRIRKVPNTNFSLSTGNTFVSATFTFEVN